MNSSSRPLDQQQVFSLSIESKVINRPKLFSLRFSSCASEMVLYIHLYVVTLFVHLLRKKKITSREKLFSVTCHPYAHRECTTLLFALCPWLKCLV